MCIAIEAEEQEKHSEIYTYDSQWHVYGMNWSVCKNKTYQLGISNLVELYSNKVEIVQLDNETGEIKGDPKLLFKHPYPLHQSLQFSLWHS